MDSLSNGSARVGLDVDNLSSGSALVHFAMDSLCFGSCASLERGMAMGSAAWLWIVYFWSKTEKNVARRGGTHGDDILLAAAARGGAQ